MAPGVLARVFEPFFTTKPAGKGTGLGLATVFAIVRQCGGHVAAASEPGRGTTLTVLLPAAGGRPSGADDRPAAPPAPEGAGTVLLVDDEPEVRRLARAALEGRGYAVLEADGGPAAVAAAAGHPVPIHLLLTDLVMPGADGRQVAEAVRAARPGVRVLFMSGYAAPPDRPPPGQVVQKPFAPLGLAVAVREALDRPGG